MQSRREFLTFDPTILIHPKFLGFDRLNTDNYPVVIFNEAGASDQVR